MRREKRDGGGNPGYIRMSPSTLFSQTKGLEMRKVNKFKFNTINRLYVATQF